MAGSSVHSYSKPGQNSTHDNMLLAKTERTGFLHLPNEIRNRIYENAIFDHDRAAVFLPRKLPRKVTFDGERIVDLFIGTEFLEEDFSTVLASVGVNSGFSYCDCCWNDGQRPPEEIPLPIFTDDETDDESEAGLVATLAWKPRSTVKSEREKRSFMETRDTAFVSEDLLSEAEGCGYCGTGWCDCLQPQISDDEDHSEDEEKEIDDADNSDKASEASSGDDDEGRGVDEEGYLIPPNRCFKEGKCFYVDRPCRFCGGFGLGEDQDETMYFDASDDDTFANDDPLEEDDEHYDREERVGMIFHAKEPGILLACKEIREQCLPLYYGSNAFSWRFFWGDQARSLARFTR